MAAEDGASTDVETGLQQDYAPNYGSVEVSHESPQPLAVLAELKKTFQKIGQGDMDYIYRALSEILYCGDGEPAGFSATLDRPIITVAHTCT